MTNEEILAGNRLIAEFMGATTCKHGIFEAVNFPDATNEGFKSYDLIYLKYHSSWDWLMAVVEKIESLGYWVKIYGFIDLCGNHTSQCAIKRQKSNSDGEYIYEYEGQWNSSKIEAVWFACLEFIACHNEQPK